MNRRRWHAVAWIAIVIVVFATIVTRHRSAALTPASMPAGQVASLSPTPTPTPSPSAPSIPSATATATIGSLTLSDGRVAAAVLDRDTGRELVANGSERFRTASIVKVDILAALLWQDERAGRTMTATQKRVATNMITASDNDAADELWATIGRATGLAAANRAFGLTNTTPGTSTAHPWGQTLTTVTDQLRLLEVITESGGPLAVAGRKYILGLMATVQSGQRWGVPAAASHSTAVYVKDGWLAEPSDNWQWIVNSIGRIVEPGHDFLVVTLSDHRRTESAGITVVERAAKTAVSHCH